MRSQANHMTLGPISVEFIAKTLGVRLQSLHKLGTSQLKLFQLHTRHQLVRFYEMWMCYAGRLAQHTSKFGSGIG